CANCSASRGCSWATPTSASASPAATRTPAGPPATPAAAGPAAAAMRRPGPKPPPRPRCARAGWWTSTPDRQRTGVPAPAARVKTPPPPRHADCIPWDVHPGAVHVPAASSPANSPASARKSPARRAWPWLLGVIVLLAAAGGGWWWWQGAQVEAEDGTEARTGRLPAQYIALEPSFVVNLADPGGNRYLQADVEVVTRDPATVAALHAHLPSVRN